LVVGVEALVKNGYEWDRNDRLGCFRHHHPPLRRTGSVCFELHHSLGMGSCMSLLSASDVLEQSASYDLGGARVRVPSPAHLTTHLLMHSQIQHSYHERIWPPLRAMYDLVRMRRRFDTELDWVAIDKSFHKAGKSAVLAMHLLQVQESLGIEPPFPIRLTSATRLFWSRRKVLRTRPALRFLDPMYMYSTVLGRRLNLLHNILKTPGGWRYLVRELIGTNFYKRLLRDVIEGRSR
jgi:hypothetical protein